MRMQSVIIALLLLLLIGPIESYSQRRGYIVRGDSMYLPGLIDFDWSKPAELTYRPKANALPRRYTINEVTEFTYDNRVFRAIPAEVDGTAIVAYAEMLVRGRVRLYKSVGVRNFYIEDGSWISLKEESIGDAMESLAATCINWGEQQHRIKNRRGSLFNFVTNHNEVDCKDIPFVSYGVSVASNWSSMGLFSESFTRNSLGDFNIKEQSFRIGVFFETPFWIIDDWSLFSQLSFGHRKFMTTGISGLRVDPFQSIIITQGIDLQHSLISFEIGPKYTFGTGNYKPYIYGSIAFDYLINQQNTLQHQTLQISGSTSAGTFKDFVPISNLQYGIGYGAGIQYFYKTDRYIALEFKSAEVFDTKITTRINRVSNLGIAVKGNL